MSLPWELWAVWPCRTRPRDNRVAHCGLLLNENAWDQRLLNFLVQHPHYKKIYCPVHQRILLHVKFQCSSLKTWRGCLITQGIISNSICTKSTLRPLFVKKSHSLECRRSPRFFDFDNFGKEEKLENKRIYRVWNWENPKVAVKRKSWDYWVFFSDWLWNVT